LSARGRGRLHPNRRALIACLPFVACVKGEGCGNNIGPEGGAADVNPELCDSVAVVRVPPGAVDHEFEACISCDDVPAGFPLDSESAMYEFSPVDLVMMKGAEFKLEYGGDENVGIAWSSDGEAASEWTVLPIDVTTFHFGSGEPAVGFAFDRFGYFVVVAGP
jgi:hypothetical protein